MVMMLIVGTEVDIFDDDNGNSSANKILVACMQDHCGSSRKSNSINASHGQSHRDTADTKTCDACCAIHGSHDECYCSGNQNGNGTGNSSNFNTAATTTITATAATATATAAAIITTTTTTTTTTATTTATTTTTTTTAAATATRTRHSNSTTRVGRHD